MIDYVPGTIKKKKEKKYGKAWINTSRRDWKKVRYIEEFEFFRLLTSDTKPLRINGQIPAPFLSIKKKSKENNRILGGVFKFFISSLYRERSRKI